MRNKPKFKTSQTQGQKMKNAKYILAAMPALMLVACGGRLPVKHSPDDNSAPASASPGVVYSVPAPVGMPAPQLTGAAVRGLLPQPDREQYQSISRHGVVSAKATPVSTFSVDVDTGAYSNVRRILQGGALPRRDAVRVEEFINYFPYDYGKPKGDAPLAIHTDVGTTPWNPHSVLMRVGIEAPDPAQLAPVAANIVLLVDVSGSMQAEERLPLIKKALKLLVPKLTSRDVVSIVTYSGRESIALEPTPGSEKAKIMAVIDSLQADGYTNGQAGIQMAYQLAQQKFIKGGINRILLATDGDFNVGISNFDQLKDLIREKRQSGVHLSTLGVGRGDYNEALMEQLADVGDGSYAYLDNLMEAQKVLVDQFASTLVTVAKDVKIQVEFNPSLVKEYRLIGYENRALAEEDFQNDKVDAGEVGAGHRVTALYEVTLQSQPGQLPERRYATEVDGTKPAAAKAGKKLASELAYVKLRYKPVGKSQSVEMTHPIGQSDVHAQLLPETQFAAAVAAYGQRLADGGKYLQNFGFDQILSLANASKGADPFGYRSEFIRMVGLSKSLAQSGQPEDIR